MEGMIGSQTLVWKGREWLFSDLKFPTSGGKGKTLQKACVCVLRQVCQNFRPLSIQKKQEKNCQETLRGGMLLYILTGATNLNQKKYRCKSGKCVSRCERPHFNYRATIENFIKLVDIHPWRIFINILLTCTQDDNT